MHQQEKDSESEYTYKASTYLDRMNETIYFLIESFYFLTLFLMQTRISHQGRSKTPLLGLKNKDLDSSYRKEDVFPHTGS